MQLEQKIFWNHRKFTISEHGIDCYMKGWDWSNEFFVPFEEIPSKAEKQTNDGSSKTSIGVIVGTISLISSALFAERGSTSLAVIIACFGLVAFGVFSVWGYFYGIERTHYFLRCANNSMFIFLDNPSSRQVVDFVNLIFESKRSFLLNKYGTIDKDRTREDNLARIIWLKDQMVIDEETYNELKYQLDHPIYGANPILGFKRSE